MPDRHAAATTICHHWPVADSEGLGEIREIQLVWNLPTGPAPLVNQFHIQPVPDGDGGPGEILVRLGYVAAVAQQDPNQPVPVTNVASFTLTRNRAEQLRGFLTEQIADWDQTDRQVRGERKTP